MTRPLWQILLETTRSDRINLTCHECVTILEYLADLGVAGVNEDSLHTAALRHLAQCSECYQEFFEHLQILEAYKEL